MKATHTIKVRLAVISILAGAAPLTLAHAADETITQLLQGTMLTTSTDSSR